MFLEEDMVKARGYAVLAPKAELVPFEFERRELRPVDVEITISHAGICHSDIHQGREEWGQARFPMVPGHEIVGRVKSVGSQVSRLTPGQLVGVGVFIDSCRTCENCLAGLQQYCVEGMTGTYNALERDGKSVAYGGYSNLIVVDEDYVVAVPESLPVEGVAPLMCAGITLYSPLRHWGAGPGKRVGIIGLGGLGHMGVKFAHAMGANVTVFSHSEKKKSDALAMGADEFVANPSEEFFKKNDNTFDLILNTVSVDVNLENYLSLLRLNGTLVLIGLPGKPYSVPAGVLLDKRRRLAGSMIGGVPELQEMLNFCGERKITSDIEVIQPNYINQAWERTVASDVKYRFVIEASNF
jgi:uncharacterized zinc-type alcohol dehydrogenase-like protein